MDENDKTREVEYENLKNSYKSLNAVIMFLGILLGGYILDPGMRSITLIVSVLAAVLGAYNYKRMDEDGKWGYLLLGLAVLWAVVAVGRYLLIIKVL
jgi:hypothetical protein